MNKPEYFSQLTNEREREISYTSWQIHLTTVKWGLSGRNVNGRWHTSAIEGSFEEYKGG